MRDYSGMIQSGLIAGILLTLSASPAVAEFDRGQALYEGHCIDCHRSWAHTRTQRTVESIEELRSKVVSWGVHSGLDWTDEDIDDVVVYLNRRFYKFTQQP
jgi:mono/diheme cytochrome c family protein